MNSTTTTFAGRLSEVIGYRNAPKFSKLSGVSARLLTSYCKGEKAPGLENLVAMANACNVSLDWLAAGIGPKMRGDGVPAEAAPAPMPGHTVEALSDWIIESQQRTLASMNCTTGEVFGVHVERLDELIIAFQVMNQYLAKLGR